MHRDRTRILHRGVISDLHDWLCQQGQQDHEQQVLLPMDSLGRHFVRLSPQGQRAADHLLVCMTSLYANCLGLLLMLMCAVTATIMVLISVAVPPRSPSHDHCQKALLPQPKHKATILFILGCTTPIVTLGSTMTTPGAVPHS